MFNSLGEKVTELVDGIKEQGKYETDFNGTGLASGVYVYRIEANSLDNNSGSFTSTKKMILVK